jgi:hypothetical protein
MRLQDLGQEEPTPCPPAGRAPAPPRPPRGRRPPRARRLPPPSPLHPLCVSLRRTLAITDGRHSPLHARPEIVRGEARTAMHQSALARAQRRRGGRGGAGGLHLQFLELAPGLEPEPAVYKTTANRPAGTGKCCPRSSRRTGRPASALLTGRVAPGGMTSRMTCPPLHLARAVDGDERRSAEPVPGDRRVPWYHPTERQRLHRPNRGAPKGADQGVERARRDLLRLPTPAPLAAPQRRTTHALRTQHWVISSMPHRWPAPSLKPTTSSTPTR